MKHLLLAAAVIQVAFVARPLLGVIEYRRSRGTFPAQRAAILALLLEVSQ